MGAAFGTVYKALKDFLDPSFWFGTLLPVALFALIHTIAYIALVGPIELFGTRLNLSEAPKLGDLTETVTLLSGALILTGYCIAPLTPMFRSLLDGTLMPGFIEEALRRGRLARVEAISEMLEACRRDVEAADKIKAALESRQSDLGQTRIGAGPDSATDDNIIETAKTACQALRKALYCSCPLAEEIYAAYDCLVGLHKTNAMQTRHLQPANKVRDQIERARRTKAAAEAIKDMLRIAPAEAAYRYQALKERYRIINGLAMPRATRIGDARQELELFASRVYGIEFRSFWPRLLACLREANANSETVKAIDAVQAGCDFAMNALMLTPSLLVWMVVAWWQAEPVVFAGFALVLPPLAAFFYEMVFWAQIRFNEVAQVTIDRKRCTVLTMLNQDMPATRGDERRLWRALQCADDGGPEGDIAYAPQLAEASAHAGTP